MAGIVFPDLAGSVLPALQAQNAQTRNAFEMDRMRRADEADMREQASAKDIPAALAGDKDALARLSPKYMLAIAPMIERMDARHQALLKGFSEWQTKAAMAMANAPPEQKVATHQAALAEGRQLGFGNFLTDMPEQYSPSVDARWKYHLDKAEPVAEYFKRQDSQLVPPPGGGAPGAAPGGVDSAGNAIAGIESKGAPNGGYGAVGPVANDKGSRAYGKYQVMDFNIPQWTAEILGKPMTPQEFLANPQAQDAVFKGKFGQYVQQAGGDQQKAAQMWFAGPGGANNPGAADVNGMTVQKYGQQFVANGGAGPQPGQATGPPVQLAGDPMVAQGGAAPIQGNPGMTGQGVAPVIQGNPGMVAQGGAPMPRTPSGTVIDASIPPPPFMPQGGDQPTGNQPGVMPVPQTYAELNAHPMARELKSLLPPGYVIPVERGTGKIRLQDGILTVLDPQGRPVQVQVPKQVDPKDRQPPPGYAPSPGGGLAFIPGGPADPETVKTLADTRRAANEKAIPQTVTKGMQENLSAMKMIDKTLVELDKRPDSVGGAAAYLQRLAPELGGDIANRKLDPEGASLRALIADIGSLKLHDRSGAAVTASETPRLVPFIPKITDDPPTIKQKLNNFRIQYETMLRDTAEYYNADNGFKEYTPATKYLNDGPQPAPAPPATPQAATPAPNKPAAATPQGGNFIGNTPDGRPVYIMPDGSKVVPQ